MPKFDKYHPNYTKLYPGIDKRPELLSAMKKIDRKMEYFEIDLKNEKFIYDSEREIAAFLPSREDSYNRIQEEDFIQFATDEPTPEATVIHSDEIRLLRAALLHLDPSEMELIRAIFFEGISERQLSKRTGIPPMTIHDRKVKILGKLKNLLEN